MSYANFFSSTQSIFERSDNRLVRADVLHDAEKTQHVL